MFYEKKRKGKQELVLHQSQTSRSFSDVLLLMMRLRDMREEEAACLELTHRHHCCPAHTAINATRHPHSPSWESAAFNTPFPKTRTVNACSPSSPLSSAVLPSPDPPHQPAGPVQPSNSSTEREQHHCCCTACCSPPSSGTPALPLQRPAVDRAHGQSGASLLLWTLVIQ